MHNNIMAAGSKDRPPMLGPGRYSQWRSRFLRYIDTKGNGEYLRKCIFEGPYKLTNVVIEVVAGIVNYPEVPQHDKAETVRNMSPENKLYFQAENEAIFLLLTSIGDEIYLTVDACNTANEMWIAIERLQQGKSLNIQDRDKDMQKNLALLAKYFKKLYKPANNNLRTSSNSRNKTEDTTSQGKDYQEVLPEESNLLFRPLEQVQNHDENNVSANERRHSEQPESINDTYVLEKYDSNVTPDSSNICKNDNQLTKNVYRNILAPKVKKTVTLEKNTNPYVSTSTRVNHSTSVSRPQLKCYQVKDKVVPNNSQVKFTKKEVEDHHRISSISKKTKSVTAYNDSSNSKTSNVNVVCAECGKCVFNSNHDACVSKYLNDVNARTKKPKVVPISASKPKRKTNKSVTTPHKKIVASDTTIQKPKSYFKELYENTNKAWKWWIEK
ncbi:hypothetical protein Tco_0620469 [Tanacetum coccineum]